MRRKFRSVMLVLLGLLVALVGCLVPVSAQAVETGSISGTVAETGGAPLVGVSVALYFADEDGFWSAVDWTVTDAQGGYELAGVPPATYRLGFHPGTTHVEEYWSNWDTVEQAEDVVVAPGASVTGRNVVLAEAGHVTGRVTGVDGASLADIVVQAHRWSFAHQDWEWRGEAITDGEGVYDIGGLSTGTYRLGFGQANDDYVDEYWNDASSLSTATDVAVSAGSTTTGKDAQLALGGAISGTVTGATGPLEDVWVSAYVYDAAADEWAYVASTNTGDLGDYRLGGLPPDSYLLSFDGDGGGLLSEYWDDATTLAEATAIPVAAGSTVSGTDAYLARGARVTGTVTDDLAAPIEHVEVTAYRWDAVEQDWVAVRGAHTEADGSYVVSGLRTGQYRLEFSDWAGSRYVDEYWDDSATLEGATTFSATADRPDVTGKNAQLARYGAISGTVADVQPGAGIWVTAYRRVAGTWEPVGETYVHEDGTYTLDRLPAGTYRIGFEDEDGVLFTEFWDDAKSIELATDITVTAGGTATGRNAALSPRTPTPTPTPPSPTPAPTPPPVVADPAHQLATILGTVRVAGKVRVGRTLTLKNLAASFRGAVTYKIQWYAGRTAIKKATKAKLKLTSALKGKVVSVKVKATSGGVTRTRTIKVGRVRG